jgi:hypothetical protein
MSKPAKDEAALLKRVGEAIRESVIQPGCCMEDTGCQIGPCGCSKEAAEAALTAIRKAGWEVAPQAELDTLRAENARLREALSFYVRIRAQPVELVKDFGNTAEAALEWKP